MRVWGCHPGTPRNLPPKGHGHICSQRLDVTVPNDKFNRDSGKERGTKTKRNCTTSPALCLSHAFKKHCIVMTTKKTLVTHPTRFLSRRVNVLLAKAHNSNVTYRCGCSVRPQVYSVRPPMLMLYLCCENWI